MTRRYFGTDGIRGTVGCDPITADFALKLGHAVGRVLERGDKKSFVLIGKDTRISGYMLESALESGLISAGADVLLLGPIPTPAVAYLVRAQRASLGIVISASHNPYSDNGIKFFSQHGTKLPDSWEQEVESYLERPAQWVRSEELGRAKRMDDASGRYIEFCKSTFDKDLSLKGLRIVVDAAHGAAYQIAPAVFHELGADVIKIGCAPDGLNINAGCGATHPSTLVAKVHETRADFGVALDGDADRVQIVDKEGRLYNGDELLYAMALARSAQGEKIEGVVGTVMTNMAIERALKKRGIDMVRAKVGDRYVLEALEEKKWLLGGEGSGHLLALDKHSTGDGLISALQVLELVVRSGKRLSDWLADAPLFPQTLLNVRLKTGMDWTQNTQLQEAQRQAQSELGENGRVLIRASGTEPVLRIMVEAQDAALASRLAQQLASTLA